MLSLCGTGSIVEMLDRFRDWCCVVEDNLGDVTLLSERIRGGKIPYRFVTIRIDTNCTEVKY